MIQFCHKSFNQMNFFIKSSGLGFIFWTLAFVSSSALSGDHVCNRTENYIQALNKTSTEPVQVRKNFWCIEKIRCSELQSEMKEVIQSEDVTKIRTIHFCCTNYEEFEVSGTTICRPICKEKCLNGICASPGKCECKIGFTGTTCNEKCPSNRYGKLCVNECNCKNLSCHHETGECLTSSPHDEQSSSTKESVITSTATDLITPATSEHNPYMNYSGEYGKDYNHYVKMGMNESDVQGSIDKVVEYEIKKATEESEQRHLVEESEGILVFDIEGNEVDTIKHPQYVTDHHAANHHDESIAMVTVGCLILGMFVFLILMFYIRRITRKVPSSAMIQQYIDPEFGMKKPQPPPSLASQIKHDPLPVPPLRPILHKQKSVTFDDSIDEVDEYDRRRTRSLPDAYDIPRKQTSMMDLSQSVKITPRDIAMFLMTDTSGFNTFPRKSISRKSSIEHIYDEIPAPLEIKELNRSKSDKINDLSITDVLYENNDTNEKTKI